MDTTTTPAIAARDRVAADHVGLVAHLVRETMARVPSVVDRNDLYAAGLLALLAAARDTDGARAAFADRATLRVRSALVDELRSVDWAVRAACPRDPISARARLDAVLAQFVDPAAAASALALAAEPTPTVALPSAGRAGQGVPRTGRDRGDRLERVAGALEALPADLRHVARGYFLDHRSLAELATELGSSEADATRLRDQALVLLRDALASATDSTSAEAVADRSTRPGERRRSAATRAIAVQYAALRSRAKAPRERTTA